MSPRSKASDQHYPHGMSAATSQRAAGVVLPVDDLGRMLDFLTEVAGFRVEKIFPADDPTHCTVVGYGCRVHLETGPPRPTVLRVECPRRDFPESSDCLDGPSGLRIEFVEADPPLELPPLVSSFSLTHAADSWHTGRAGMHYRDLVPDRQGGAVIASHIRIPNAGPVPDYVHFHEIAFQLIFCRRGWVRVVYEDCGEPFVLEAGDCVTQPPRIRHRVLESSDDLEVVEIGYPAEHITRADPETRLPSTTVNPSRRWSGQSFVHHRRSDSFPVEIAAGVTSVNTGVDTGTRGLADVSIVEIDSSSWISPTSRDREFVLLFSLDGNGGARLRGPVTNHDCLLEASSALVVPVGHEVRIETDDRISLLQVRIQTS